MTTKHPDSTDENGSGKASVSHPTYWEVVIPYRTEAAAKKCKELLEEEMGINRAEVREVAQ